MKNFQKGFIAPLLIAFLALTIGGSVFIYTKSKQFSQSRESLIDTLQSNTKIATTTLDTSALPEDVLLSVMMKNSASDSNNILLSMSGYGRDENYVYYKGKITDFNPKTFIVFPANGKYVKDDTIVYYGQEKIIDADPLTFVVFKEKDYFAIDKNHVYHEGKITGYNPNTFIVLPPDGNYVKDDVGVYFVNRKVDADPATFTTFKDVQWLAKDKNRVFLRGRPVIVNSKGSPSPDAETFMLVVGASGFSRVYAKDISRVYDISGVADFDEIKVVEGADPKTFVEIGSFIRYNASGYAYAKDKSHVYSFNKILDNVDVDSFEFVGQADLRDPECMGYCGAIITKDKQCIYINDNQVLGLGGVCLNPSQCTKETINTNCGESVERICSSRVGDARDQCIKFMNEED